MNGQNRGWFETISPYLALASFVCSIALPFILFHFLVTSVREAELRLGTLIVDGTYSSENGIERWSASIENNGLLPLSNVSLLFRSDAFPRSSFVKCHSREGPTQSNPTLCIVIDPPLGDASQSGDAINISLGVMPHKEHRIVTIFIPPDPDRPPSLLLPGKGFLIPDRVSGWSHSDANPTTPIPWRYARSGFVFGN